jgi:prepilin-type N-terminal cleavage/methylation domain-containing protein
MSILKSRYYNYYSLLIEKMYKRNKVGGNKGFTLIELLVVIAIIGILSSVVLASLNTARRKARDARRVSDIKNLQLALELQADDNSGNYAADLAELVTDGYISSVALDPLTDAAPFYASLGAEYHIGVTLEDTASMPDNDANCDSTATPVCFAAELTQGTGFDGADVDVVIYDQRD